MNIGSNATYSFRLFGHPFITPEVVAAACIEKVGLALFCFSQMATDAHALVPLVLGTSYERKGHRCRSKRRAFPWGLVDTTRLQHNNGVATRLVSKPLAE